MTVPGEPETWRLFIAAPVPDHVRGALMEMLSPLRDRVPARWQSAETWHLTLRFLGQTTASTLPVVRSAVAGAARIVEPFPLELGRAGAFEQRHGGRVAWIGVTTGEEQLAVLAKELATRLAPQEPDRGPFRAHLTIAREAPESLARDIEGALWHRTPGSLAWTSDTLILYRSVLGRGGATHSALLEAPLGRARERVAREAPPR